MTEHDDETGGHVEDVVRVARAEGEAAAVGLPGVMSAKLVDGELKLGVGDDVRPRHSAQHFESVEEAEAYTAPPREPFGVASEATGIENERKNAERRAQLEAKAESLGFSADMPTEDLEARETALVDLIRSKTEWEREQIVKSILVYAKAAGDRGEELQREAEKATKPSLKNNCTQRAAAFIVREAIAQDIARKVADGYGRSKETGGAEA